MKRLLLLILAALTLSAASAQPLPPPMPPIDPALLSQAEAHGTVRVMVQFSVPTAGRSVLEAADAIKLFRLGLIGNTRGVARLVANSETWTIPYAALEVDAAALQSLAGINGVTAVSLDIREERHLDAALPLINIDGAHARGSGLNGAGKMIVILDDGIEASHPFFSGRVVAEACFSNAVTSVDNPGTANDIYGSRPNCPNAQTSQFGTGAASTTTCGSTCNHGTHVAGIAASSDATYRGAAPGASIAMINVFHQTLDLNNQPMIGSIGTYVSDQVAALQHVSNTLRLNFDVVSVNMSLGGGLYSPGACESFPSDAIQQARVTAINALTDAGIAVVISAGNDANKTQISRPACISSAVAVSSVDGNGTTVSSFSNVSSGVDFFAPGNNIVSAGLGGGTRTDSGTSMAAPFVAGAIAVIKQAVPNASLPEILSALTATGTPVTDVRSGAPGNITRPLIQVDKAIDVLRFNGEQIDNGDFESVSTPGTPDYWTKSGAAALKCNNINKTFTPFDDCAMKMMVNSALGAGNLKQTVDSPRGIMGDSLTLTAEVNARNVIKGQLVMIVTYVNLPKVKVKINIVGTYGWDSPLPDPKNYVLTDTLKGLSMNIKTTLGGKYFLDNVSVSFLKTPLE